MTKHATAIRKSPLWKSPLWKSLTLAFVALCLAAPIGATMLGGLAAKGASAHLLSTLGLQYLAGTLLLCTAVGAGTLIIGAGTAMLVSLTDFPGRRFFSIALVLPFAIPAYVAAYSYADLLGPFGAVASIVGASTLPEIRSLPGAVFILTLMTYPYVYLAMSASLAGRSGALMETARSLGASPITAARKILLGAGRPALAGGLALALMETAADYGVADYYGVKTLSVGIFRTWYGLGDLGAATQLAAGLFLTVLLLVLLEEAGRRGRSTENARVQRANTRIKLSASHARLAMLVCAAPVLLGFVIPAGILLGKLEPELSIGAARGLAQSVSNTTLIASLGAGLAIVIALLLAYAARQMKSPMGTVLLRVATLGYAIPGAVIAIGILSLTASLSQITGLGLAGGIGVLLYAYVARFLTAGYNAASGGLSQVSLQMDEAARSLGAGPGRIWAQVHWPQTRGAILAGAAIIAIDIAKELPATLLLRPFNFETLSTRIYRFAADERLADAAPAALLLIVLGLLPTLALSALARAQSK